MSTWMRRLHEEYRSGGNPDVKRCPCYGNGWLFSPVDTVSRCQFHFRGQPHPEDERPDEIDRETVEHVLKKGDESVTFQIMDGKWVNVYEAESSLPIRTKIKVAKARNLWQQYRSEGYQAVK